MDSLFVVRVDTPNTGGIAFAAAPSAWGDRPPGQLVGDADGAAGVVGEGEAVAVTVDEGDVVGAPVVGAGAGEVGDAGGATVVVGAEVGPDVGAAVGVAVMDGEVVADAVAVEVAVAVAAEVPAVAPPPAALDDVDLVAAPAAPDEAFDVVPEDVPALGAAALGAADALADGAGLTGAGLAGAGGASLAGADAPGLTGTDAPGFPVVAEPAFFVEGVAVPDGFVAVADDFDPSAPAWAASTCDHAAAVEVGTGTQAATALAASCGEPSATKGEGATSRLEVPTNVMASSGATTSRPGTGR